MITFINSQMLISEVGIVPKMKILKKIMIFRDRPFLRYKQILKYLTIYKPNQETSICIQQFIVNSEY